MDPPLANEQRAKVEQFREKHRTALFTLVFTDLVGSTKRKQDLGDFKAVPLIQQHHALVRQLLRDFPEAEEIETAGDSFLIVFVRPSDAVKFCLLLHARLRAMVQATGYPMADRAGIHFGEVIVHEETDVTKLFGSQVDTCGRLVALAQGGQTLLTRFAFDNARQILRDEDIKSVGEMRWLSHGPYLLKGLEEPVEICEVCEAGIAPLRPPPDSEKVHRHVSADAEPVLGWRPAIGQAVPNTKWVLEQKLGEGGFGEVWLGRHQNLKERRVFKFCFRADRVRSLKREMTLFRVLKERVGDHPNIVRLLEVNFDEPPYYLETDHVEGQDLKAWCEQQGGAEKVPLAARLEIVAQIADALQSAHDAGGVIKSGRGQTWIIRKAPSPRQAGSTVLPEPRSRQQRRTGFQPVFFTSPTSDHTRAKRHGDSDGVDTTPGIVSLKPKPYHDKTLPEGSVLPDRHGARQIGSLQMKSLGHELICHAPRIVQSQTRIGTNQSNQMLETYAGNLNSLSGDRAPACEAFDPYALGVAPIPSRFLSLPPCPAPGGRIRWR